MNYSGREFSTRSCNGKKRTRSMNFKWYFILTCKVFCVNSKNHRNRKLSSRGSNRLTNFWRIQLPVRWKVQIRDAPTFLEIGQIRDFSKCALFSIVFKERSYSEVKKLSSIKLSEFCINFRNLAETFGVFWKSMFELCSKTFGVFFSWVIKLKTFGVFFM